MLVVKTLHRELHALQLEGEIGGRSGVKQKAQALLLIEERRQRATGSLERVLKGFAIALLLRPR